jgi:hypothetical protein
MRFGLSRSSTRELIAALMLAAFAVRALVPEGFMPARDGSLAVEICPEGFPTQLLPHAAHHHGGSHADHCAFGCAGAGGPLTSPAPIADPSPAWRSPARQLPSVAVAVRLVHLPQPRAPPRVS